MGRQQLVATRLQAMNIGVLALTTFVRRASSTREAISQQQAEKSPGFVAYANLSDNTPPTLTLNR